VRLLLATHGFSGFGGSETYLLTVAEQLERLGHEVTLAATDGGPMADFATARGLQVVIGERGLPEAVDAILVQDAALSYRLAERYAGTPQVFRACSEVYDFVLPPQLPGVVAAVVVANDRIARRVASMATEHEIVRLRQPVDTRRFVPRGELRAQPRRAVLLGNYLAGERRRMLEGTWGRAGVECVVVGAGGETLAQPEEAIAEADIVVGKARAIVDGMACGRAAYVFDSFGGDGWVTPERYPALEADNFSGHATDWTLSEEQLAADIAAYRPEMGLANRDLALQHHAARDHAYALVELLGRATAAAVAPIAPLGELARLVRVQCATEFELFSLQATLAGRTAALRAAEARVAELEATPAPTGDAGRIAQLEGEVARLHARLATRRARAGLAIGRAADAIRRR
jgi:hypothetical protein